MRYEVEVKKQGSHVTSHILEARTALTAINLVEIYYGAPLQYETISLEDERKRRRPCLLVNHWHGYTFEARVVNPVANGEVNIEPVREVWHPSTL